MSKRERKVAFKEEVEITVKKRRTDEESEEDGKNSRFKAKHSLDSDEEDERDEIEGTGLGDEDLAAQEEDTVRYDDGIKVTPFNLQEEMEEGRFDAHGNYYLKKDPESVQDNWLEGVDWNRIEEQREWVGIGGAKSDKAKESPEPEVDKLVLYKQIVEILRPGETLTKAVKRLGGKKSLSASDKWKKQKKKGISADPAPNNQEMSVDKETLERLTELADKLVATGDYSVYENTYEQIKYNVSQQEKAAEPVDMFADIEESSASRTSSSSVGVASESSNEVFWEYKWKNEDNEKIHGPFTSTQMADWQSGSFFPEGVWVRKTGNPDSRFYSSKRIDFDLYT